MVDEERDAGLSATDDETDASDDADQRSSDGDAGGADDAPSSSNDPVYGRVTPRSETVTHGSDDDASADVATEMGDNGDGSDSGTDAAPDDTNDSAIDSDTDSNDEPRLLTDGEHASHVPEGTYDNSSDESADDIDLDTAADGASPAPTDKDEMGGVAPSSVSTENADFDDEDVDDLVGEAPESDQKIPLTAHIEKTIRRLAVVLGITGTVTFVLFPGANIFSTLMDMQAAFGVHVPSATNVINFLWNSHIPGAEAIVDRRPQLYDPLKLILTKLRVAGFARAVIGLPTFVYETYLFMHPGLYPKERKYCLAATPTSLVLAFVSILFVRFVVLPAIFACFTSYTEGTVIIAFGLKETLNLIPILMGYMTIVFQIPLFVEPAIMMNLAARRWLEDRRLLFWGTFLGLTFLVSPDPTGVAFIIIGATMITPFEGTLAALRWTGD